MVGLCYMYTKMSYVRCVVVRYVFGVCACTCARAFCCFSMGQYDVLACRDWSTHANSMGQYDLLVCRDWSTPANSMGRSNVLAYCDWSTLVLY